VLLALLLASACRSGQPQRAVEPAVELSPGKVNKKWKYATYFIGIKEAVRAKWKVAEQWRLIDPDGKTYGRDDRYTLLRVRLRPDGTVADTFVETSSGIPLLDNLAARAFHEAAPFPPPPPQLVEKGSGLVDFRFGFYFDLDGKPGKPAPHAELTAQASTSADGGGAPGDGHADDGG
jgi:TonB family protein